eukprot:6056550-Amphidinium_carterae.1
MSPRWSVARSQGPRSRSGEQCVRRGGAKEDLGRIVHHCPHCHKERRESGLPASARQAPPCVRSCQCQRPRIFRRMSQLLSCVRVRTLCGLTDRTQGKGCGCHSLQPWALSVGFSCRASGYGQSLEACNPNKVVRDCKGVILGLHGMQQGHRHPKGRHRELKARAC